MFRLAPLALVLWFLGCGSPPPGPVAAPATAPPMAEERSVEVTPPAPAERGGVRIVFLGDSLTAGLGLAESQAFPALVGNRLRREGLDVTIVNAGVSGDTSSGGLRRIDWLLRQRPEIVVVELGANDGLRGQPVEMIESNLRDIVSRALAEGAEVLLLGIQVPPSYGADYAEAFAGIFPRVAEELEVRLVPFLLEGVAGLPELNLPDGIHPTAAGHEVMAETVTPALAEMVRDLEAR